MSRWLIVAALFTCLMGSSVMTGCGVRQTADLEVQSRAMNTAPPPAPATASVQQDDPERDTDTEWLIDSLAATVDSLRLPGVFEVDLPDISDSLAAATEAQLPSVDELFDYPVDVNHRVLTWVDYFLGKGRQSFEVGLKRSGRYLALARRVFAEEGVPQDLAFLAHIESGFRHNARSSARALGLWQFMRGTASLYNLRCDSYVDERLDPEKSTRACAQHLRDLHDEFNDWYLALAAYNAGAGKVNRAIRKTGTRDFWTIARTRYLVNETRNFVPEILAATLLAKSPGAYGFSELTDPPLEYDSVTVDSPTDLRVTSSCTGVSVEELQKLNPALLLMQTPRTAEYAIHVPKGSGERFAREIAKIPADKRLVFHRHVVGSGQTLGQLARRYGTTVRAIQDANRLGRKTTIYVGNTLLIPSRHGGTADYALLGGDGAVNHTVQRGDCISGIAAHYGVQSKAIIEVNGLTDPGRIHPGQILAIPVPPQRRSTTTAGDDALAERQSTQDDGAHRSRPTHTLRAQNNSDSLGRVPTTAHIVEQAREAIRLEEEQAAAQGPPPNAGPITHVVRRGDTLSEIASRYGVQVNQLRSWNGLGRSHVIHPGQELSVVQPSGVLMADARIHTVRRGESIWLIAQHYGVRVSDLLNWNNLSRRALIYPGQKLRLY